MNKLRDIIILTLVGIFLIGGYSWAMEEKFPYITSVLPVAQKDGKAYVLLAAIICAEDNRSYRWSNLLPAENKFLKTSDSKCQSIHGVAQEFEYRTKKLWSVAEIENAMDHALSYDQPIQYSTQNKFLVNRPENSLVIYIEYRDLENKGLLNLQNNDSAVSDGVPETFLWVELNDFEKMFEEVVDKQDRCTTKYELAFKKEEREFIDRARPEKDRNVKKGELRLSGFKTGASGNFVLSNNIFGKFPPKDRTRIPAFIDWCKKNPIKTVPKHDPKNRSDDTSKDNKGSFWFKWASLGVGTVALVAAAVATTVYVMKSQQEAQKSKDRDEQLEN